MYKSFWRIDNFAEKTLYAREEARRLKEAFWTAFGQYMRVVPSAEGERINWVNYRTGIKHLYFRMDADAKTARIFVEMNHPDKGIRELMFEQLISLKSVWQQEMGDDWEWIPEYSDEYGKVFALVCKQITDVNVHNQNDWPDLISFFKSNIMALDSFWSTARYSFDLFK